MNTMVTIPLDLYRLLESQCADNTPEFRLLKSGLIEQDLVMIRCDTTAADSLRNWAEECLAGAGGRISLAPDPVDNHSEVS